MYLDIPQLSVKIQDKLALFKAILTAKSFDVSTGEGRSKERYRKVILTVGWSFVSKGVTTLTALVSVPLAVHYLGAERYGLWMTISSTVAFLSFADLGLGNGLLNAISKADGLGSKHSVLTAVSSSFFMLTSIAFLLAAIFLSIYPFLSWGKLFNVSSSIAVAEVGPSVVILAVVFFVNLPLGIVQRIQMGFQDGYSAHLWQALGALLGLLGVLISIYFQAGLPWLILAAAAGPLLATCMNGVHLFGFKKPQLLPRWKYFDFATSRELSIVGGIFFCLQMFALFGNSSIDNIVIAHSLGASAVAKYSVVQRLFSVTLVAQYFLAPLWPAFGEAMARRDYVWARRALTRAIRLSLGMGMLVGVILLIFGKWFISIWVGPNYIPSISLLLGFVFWGLVNCYMGSISTFLNSGSLVGKQMFFFGLASMVSLLLKIIGVKYFGVEGVVWATVLGYGLFYVIPAKRLAYGVLGSPRVD